MRQSDDPDLGGHGHGLAAREREAEWLSGVIAALRLVADERSTGFERWHHGGTFRLPAFAQFALARLLVLESLSGASANDVPAPEASELLRLLLLSLRQSVEQAAPSAQAADAGELAALGPRSLQAFGSLEVVSAEGAVAADLFPPRFRAYVGALEDLLVELARGVEDADVRLELGLRAKGQLRRLIEAAQGDDLRYHRQLAILMFDAIRRVRPESLTERHVFVLQECADRLLSETVTRDVLQACDQALLQAGMDALPDVPED